VKAAIDGEPIQMLGLDSIRDFLDVSDIVAAYFALLDAPSLPFSAFNVASGQPTSISDVVRATARILHKPIGEVLFSARETRPTTRPSWWVTPSVCAPQPDGSLASASRKVCSGWPPARRESNPGGLTCRTAKSRRRSWLVQDGQEDMVSRSVEPRRQSTGVKPGDRSAG
jgi:hypothetical protein